MEKKQILTIASGLYHPPLPAVWKLRRLVKNWASKHQFKPTFSSTINVLSRGNSQEVSALVLYFHQQHISKKAFIQFENFVNGGGNVLAIRSVTASFKQARGNFFEILGGRFTGHGPVEEFTISPVPNSSIFGDYMPFVVRDELYIHELEDDITPHFTSKHQGVDVPVVWSKQFAGGKILYACPGHTTETLNHPTYQMILQQALTWITNE